MNSPPILAYVPTFLDGSIHTPAGNDVYVHVRVPDDASTGPVTVFLSNGTALVVRPPT